MNVVSLRPINQSFRLKMEGVNYNFRMLYNQRASTWTLDITTEEGEQVAMGVALKLGTTPIYFLRKRIGDVVSYDTSRKGVEADFDNLSDTVLFVQLTEAEIGG